jgi:Fic family protein
MISLYLAATGLLKKPALYLSDYFERNKTAYVDHLMAVREGSHLREWLVFFLYGVETTARDSAAVFREILELKHRIESEVLPCYSARRLENARALINALYSHPIVDVKRATGIIKGTGNTASALIGELVSQNLLHEITGRQRDRLFAFQPYLALFQRSPE